MAVAFVLMVIFSLAWVENTFNLPSAPMGNTWFTVFLFALIWAVISDLRK